MLANVCRGGWGNRVEVEPQDYTPYSQHRPDLVAHLQARCGKSIIGDVKIGDPITSEPTTCGRRGTIVGMGNTAPGFDVKVHGLAERGSDLSEQFNPTTGRGHVDAVDGDYAQAKQLGHEVRALVFESFGGFGKDVVRLLKQLAGEVSNKLSARQFDETSWSARSWLSFQTQRLSVALHLALAFEIGHELGLGVCLAADPRDAGGDTAAA